MHTLGLIIIALFTSILSVGCGSECGDLQDVCDSCSGATKTQCEEVANADDDMACESAVASYESDCAPASDE